MKLNYKYAESTVKPSEVEVCKNTVYLRKDIASREYEESIMWTYQEAILTLDEYENLSKASGIKMVENQETGDNNQLIIMEAIADLYDEISKIRGGQS